MIYCAALCVNKEKLIFIYFLIIKGNAYRSIPYYLCMIITYLRWTYNIRIGEWVGIHGKWEVEVLGYFKCGREFPKREVSNNERVQVYVFLCFKHVRGNTCRIIDFTGDALMVLSLIGVDSVVEPVRVPRR